MYRLGVYPGHDAALRPEPSGARRTNGERLPVPLSTNVLLHPVALPPCRPASSTPRPCVAPVPTSHRSGRRSVFSQWQGSKQGRPLSHTGVSRSDFELGRVLGRGSFGTVALATKTSRGSQPRDGLPSDQEVPCPSPLFGPRATRAAAASCRAWSASRSTLSGSRSMSALL